MKKNINLRKLAGAAALAACLLAGSTVSAQRTVILWQGDYRVGLHAGVDHSLGAFEVKVPTGYTLEKSTPALVQPKVGLYYGMEKDLSGNFAIGFDATADLGTIASSATVKNAAGQSFDYSFSATCFSVYEGIYLSYYLTDEFALNGGVGLDENAWLNCKGTATPTEGAPGCQFGDGMMIGMGVGVGVRAGVSYNFSESFFVKGDVQFSTAPFYGTATMSEMMGDDWGSMWGDSSSLTVNPGESARVGLMATIGVKW